MADDTIFHKIVRGEIPATVLYQDDDVLIFKDIHPKATTHVLIIPKRPEEALPSIAEMTDATSHVPGMLIQKAQQFAKEQGIDGYKLQFNVGTGGGQEVFYIHLHLLSSQSLAS